MPSVNDWMARAARQIRDDLGRGRVDRIAAVISIHAGDEVEKTKQTLLSVVPMQHVECEDRDCTTYCGRCAIRPLSFATLVAECPTVSVVEGTKATMHTFESGAKSSHVLPPFHLIPRAALRLLAERFKLGAEMRGEEWAHRRGVKDDAFIKDRVNHMIEHSFAFAEGRKESDLAAVMCNAAMIADILELRKGK